MGTNRFFSNQLQAWLKDKRPKTLASLVNLFQDKSFAVAILLLMVIPATPLPTGGVTHVFELIAILLALEMVWGRKMLWVPRRWQKVDVSGIARQRAFVRIIQVLTWIERHSRPRLRHVIQQPLFERITGLLIVILCTTAFLAPPFSGLDTLPSLAVVLMALSIIFEDALLYVVGLVVGAIGIGAVIALGDVALKSFKHLF